MTPTTPSRASGFPGAAACLAAAAIAFTVGVWPMLPGHPPPRPPELMRRPYAWSDATVVYADFGDTAQTTLPRASSASADATDAPGDR